MKTGRRDLDKASFEALLGALHADRNEAGAVYERLRQRVVRFFTLHGISFPDDLADQAIDRLARRLKEGEVVRNLPAYLAGIARLILREERSKAQRQEENLGRAVPAQAPSSQPEPAWDTIEHCLQLLPPGSRDLIQQYYSAAGRGRSENRSRMSKELGISLNALRNRALRIRRELQKCAEGQSGEQPPQDD
jgi:DNA-directed RNA polymerase specialized sigma24 family protein